METAEPRRRNRSGYRATCTNCNWRGVRFLTRRNECTCAAARRSECHPLRPNWGCTNGVRLHAACPQCRNLRIAIRDNAPMVYHDRGTVLLVAIQADATGAPPTSGAPPASDVAA